MGANIKNLCDALEWLDRSIREEAMLDGETTNDHAIQLGFIQSMLEKFPLRNCDVGTAVEQAKRFHEFCHAHQTFYTDCSDGCPFKDAPDINHCMCGWGQLSYETVPEGGDK